MPKFREKLDISSVHSQNKFGKKKSDDFRNSLQFSLRSFSFLASYRLEPRGSFLKTEIEEGGDGKWTEIAVEKRKERGGPGGSGKSLNPARTRENLRRRAGDFSRVETV